MSYKSRAFDVRIWIDPREKGVARTSGTIFASRNLACDDCNSKIKPVTHKSYNGTEVLENYHAIQLLDKKVRNIQRQLAATKVQQKSLSKGAPPSILHKIKRSNITRKYLMFIGINTALSSWERRDSIRSTWMPEGEIRRKLEEDKGIIIRFVTGHSSMPGDDLEKAVETEERMHKDFLRLDHVESYRELSTKTKTYFATAVALWDADFYVKVDDDIHVNIGMLAKILIGHYNKPRLYIGCLEFGPVIHQKGLKYYEPEHWKFGDKGNNYFLHASRHMYAISRDLAIYISKNRDILHKYANEDVSLGTWLIGSNVDHVNDKRLCCNSPPDCQWRHLTGRTCAATFDWECSGICRSSERIKEIHERCSEDDNSLWHPFY